MIRQLDIGKRLTPAGLKGLELQESRFCDAELRKPEVTAELVYLVAHSLADPTAVMQEIERCLQKHKVVLLRNCPLGASQTFLAGLTADFGELAEPYQQPNSLVVRHIRISEARKIEDSSSSGTLNEILHTDGTDWPVPNSLTCLLCVKPDRAGGGVSRILRYSDLIDGLDMSPITRQAFKALWERELEWKLAPEFNHSTVSAPAFSQAGVRWLRFAVDALQTVEVEHYLSTIEAEIERLPGVEELLLTAGDLLIIDNRQALHARTAVANPEETDRLLLRTKVVRNRGASDVITNGSPAR